MSQKPAIRVRAADGKPRDWEALRAALGGQTFIRVYAQTGNVEFILTADSPKQLDGLREKLAAAGVEEVVGGDTTIATAATSGPAGTQPHRQGGPQQHRGQPLRGGPPQQRGGHQQQRDGAPQGRQTGPTNNAQPLPGKPYGFVSLAKDLKTATPIWHDGTSTKGRLSGEIRLELETLTPLLVGWERGQVGDNESEWPVPANLPTVGQLKEKKSVLCPLRAPWGKRPVVVPGDSLKGLLRHELGALLGAPMERVGERSYSYRPNAMYPLKPENRFLVPRLARVLKDHIETKALDRDHQARVPSRLELFPATLEYNKKANKLDYRFDQQGGAPYRGGQGAGQKLNSKPKVHTSLKVLLESPVEAFDLSKAAQDGYLATVRHLVDLDHGHFSERHPDVPKIVAGDAARARILKAAKDEVFQPGDLVWVEWDTEKKCIVSLGWHYYYRWAYTDTVRNDADAPRLERRGLFPLDKEREKDGDAPNELSLVRRLLGYTGDNEGSAGIGEGDHAQLMGRVFVNAGLEVVADNDSDDDRFLKPTFLKELGMPRPSAVEHYLKQPQQPHSRPSDTATLVTYGDAAGYDAPGELAGRKFYLDRPKAVAEDASDTNKQNDRSTLALEASRPGRKFRFTVRFRDLDAAELEAVVVALCPDQFKTALGGTHADGYCSKLGYARPLGWGSVRIEAKQLLLLDEAVEAPTLRPKANLAAWLTKNHQNTPTQDEWLGVHRRNHPDAADYPRARDRDSNENIYTFHTDLRAKHSRNRRYKDGGSK